MLVLVHHSSSILILQDLGVVGVVVGMYDILATSAYHYFSGPTCADLAAVLFHFVSH